MVPLDRRTVLKPIAGCNLKHMPLTAVEGFVFSQLDGSLSLDEVAQIVSIDFVEAARVVQKLLSLGAVEVAARSAGQNTAARRPDKTRITIKEEDARPRTGSTRLDSRSEEREVSVRFPGIAAQIDARVEKMSTRPPRIAEKRSSSRPPRSERAASIPPLRSERAASIRPPRNERAASMRPPRSRIDPRAEEVSIRPPPHRSPSPSPSPSPQQPPRRATRKSIRMERAAIIAAATAAAKKKASEEKCELDDAAQDAIFALDLRVSNSDFYTALDVDRTADKKAIKRAYFAFVAKSHPDRYFGKKLGPLRVVVERVFHRMTEAHDTLIDAAKRASYDATLPPLPKPRVSKAPTPRLTPAPISIRERASTKPPASMRTSTKAPPSMPRTSTKAPPSMPRTSTKAPPSMPRTSTKAPPSMVRTSTKAPPASVRTSKAPPRMSKAPPAITTPGSGGPQRRKSSRAMRRPSRKLRDLHVAAKQIKVQARVEMCLQAAEEAMLKDDVIGAANNYRLALQHMDDPYIRAKLEDVEARAKTLRFTRGVTQGRIAERDQRWADAAIHFARAHEVKPTADIADRAAQAMRLMSSPDLDKALVLAEQAVAIEPKNQGYRLTLAEVCFAANRLMRAEEELESALDLGPSDSRTKALASAISRKKKS